MEIDTILLLGVADTIIYLFNKLIVRIKYTNYKLINRLIANKLI